MRKRLGHYELISELGRGGMGVVYKAHEMSLNRDVAIKVLSQQTSHDETLLARFRREARSAAALNHPHIIQIYFVGEDRGQHYFVMEYVKGESLSQLLSREGRLPPARAAQIVIQTASGLAAAHQRQIVHRDIKPGNIMLTRQGRVKIADFGIAFMPDPDQKLTETGQFLGTPGYLSPEVCMARPADGRSDIFSLGMVYFEMLIGETPFKGDSLLAVLQQVVEREVPDVCKLNEKVSSQSRAILAKMTAKDPERRYQRCEELTADLERLQSSQDTLPSTIQLAVPPVPASPELSAAGTSAPPLPPTEKTAASPRATEATEALPPPPLPAAEENRPHQALPSVKPVAVIPPKRQYASGKRWMLPLVALGLLVAAGIFAAPRVMEMIRSRDSVVPPPQSYRQDADSPLKKQAPATASNQLNHLEARHDGGETGEDSAFKNNGGEPPSESAAALEAPSREESQATQTTHQIKGRLDHDPTPEQETDNGTSRQGLVETAMKKAGGGGAISLSGSVITHSPSAGTMVNPAETSLTLTNPVISVVATGDPLLAEAIKATLITFLDQENRPLLDEGAAASLDAFADRGSPDIAGLSRAVHGLGGDVLILAEVIYLGQRELYYSGRSSTAYQARIKFRCLATADQRGLGAIVQREVEYTTLNATRAAEKTVLDVFARLTRAIEGEQP